MVDCASQRVIGGRFAISPANRRRTSPVLGDFHREIRQVPSLGYGGHCGFYSALMFASRAIFENTATSSRIS